MLMPVPLGADPRDATSVKDELVQSCIVFIGNHSPWMLAPTDPEIRVPGHVQIMP